MNSKYEDFDAYEAYEAQFDPLRHDRRARRKRRAKPGYQPKQTHQDIIAASADPIGLEAGLNITYRPSRHEADWLFYSLRPFYDQELIVDVEALVKGGKEANVYRCAAHPATGHEWLAVKVYRPRFFRNLRNDHIYRRGRLTLETSGRPMKANDKRLIRALDKRSNLGQQMMHTSWLMHEYSTLELLFDAGAAVPKPLAAAENAIIMAYIGNDYGAAPALNEIALDRGEALFLFKEVMRNVILMLRFGRIHADLSAYNILYWNGKITLIDFPQVVNSRIKKATHIMGSRVNPDAASLLERDITRVCEYFTLQGVRCDAQQIFNHLWQVYVEEDPEVRLADASHWEE
ncbi:MAG: RIO1 family regulatory kinase/ATPase [Candidatus Promineifilaceae bacterium]|nr:RIO1 family regulatory kinase/ATPase [Candidatus Promineifilaceae bacterium]